MGKVQLLRRRIRSVKSTRQITKTMEMVSASKMKRAQDRVVAARPFATMMREVIGALDVDPSLIEHPLMRQPAERRVASIYVFTSNRGLAGSFNANLVKRAQLLQSDLERLGLHVRLHVAGKKGVAIFRYRGHMPLTTWTDLSDRPSFDEADRIAQVAIAEFAAGETDEVYLVYARFNSPVHTPPFVERILPAGSTAALSKTLLGVCVTIDSELVPAGDQVQFLIEAANNGLEPLSDVTVSAVLDDDLEFVQLENLAPGLTVFPHKPEASTRVLTFAVPSLLPTDTNNNKLFDLGEGYVIGNIVARTPERQGKFCNRVSISANTSPEARGVIRDTDMACVTTMLQNGSRLRQRSTAIAGGARPLYLLTPSAEEIFTQLLPLYVRNSVYRALTESAAGEHGARRTAMKNATDNAGELLEDLHRTFNRARQAQITQEIAELMGGSEALKG